jgi:hypothetical protein
MLAQRDALDDLGNQVGLTLVQSKIKDPHEILMTQLRDDAPLAQEPILLLAVQPAGMKRLEGDAAIQFGIVSEPDRSEGAGAELALNLETSERFRLRLRQLKL